MLNRKEIITSLALVFMLLGCDSSSQQLSNGSDNQERISKTTAVELKPSNWYIRLVAEDPTRGLKSVTSQLGQLEEDDAVANHTLTALTPFDSSYLDVIFRDPAGVASGDYKVNFHSYEEGSEDRWSFTVRTDDNTTDILLTWRGLYVLTPYEDEQGRQRYNEYRSATNPLVKNMKLIDSSNGKEMAAVVNDKVQTYSFNMEGQTERTFEWVVQVDEVLIPLETNKSLVLNAKVIQQDVSKSKKIKMFDLNKPPMVKEESFGK